MTSTAISTGLTKLQKLYKDSPSARAILDHFASRERNSSTTTVERIRSNVAAAGADVPRGDVIQVFKTLEDAGFGHYKVGRKGWETRFEWTAEMISVGQAAAGEAVKVEQLTPEAQAKEPEVSLRHTYRLRPETSITLELPRDFTSAEAERLAQFIRSLPFERDSAT